MQVSERQPARQFLEWVLGTEENELDCAGLMAIVDQYVDGQVRGLPGDLSFEAVPQHLRQCPDCARLVAALSEIVQLEEAGNLPPLGALWDELRSLSATPVRAASASTGRKNAGNCRLWSGWAQRRPLQFGESWSVAAIGVSGVLLIALIVAISGWWRVAREARTAQDIVAHLSTADLVRSAEMVDGSRATVYFSPEDHRALVHLDLNRRPPTRIRCWLSSDRDSASPEETTCGPAAPDWWFLTCEQPLANYARLALTLEPQSVPAVELPLLPERSR